MRPLTAVGCVVAWALANAGPAGAQPGRARGRRKKSDLKRKVIIEAAARVFKNKGYAEATLSEIVDDLAKTFNAPRERIMVDVSAMLTGLVDKQLMEV